MEQKLPECMQYVDRDTNKLADMAKSNQTRGCERKQKATVMEKILVVYSELTTANGIIKIKCDY